MESKLFIKKYSIKLSVNSVEFSIYSHKDGHFSAIIAYFKFYRYNDSIPSESTYKLENMEFNGFSEDEVYALCIEWIRENIPEAVNSGCVIVCE